MLHFLSKIGNQPWSKASVHVTTGVVSCGYLLFHMFGHKQARNFFVARDSSGLNIELTDRVKTLVVDTYNDIGDQLYQDILTIPGFPMKKSPIKWFASTTMEPINFGLTDALTGVLIGLPYFYNHTKTMDIPDSMIRFRKMRFFKKIFKDPEGDKIDQSKDRTKFGLNQDLIPPWEATIDRKNPTVKSYLDSMILSDEAIKFSIARELFLGDTYRPLIKAALIAVTSFASLLFSRYLVHTNELGRLHVSRRLGVYGLVGSFFTLQYFVISGVIERQYTEKADKLAIAAGDSYRRGAKEYFEKLRIRNQCLHELFEDAREVFRANGDRIDGLIYRRFIPLEERLSWTEEPEIEPKSKPEKDPSKQSTDSN